MGRENHNQKLLVEGKDDQHVIWALCEKFQLTQNFDVIDCNGISNLYQQLPVRFKQSGVETIGIIIDADTNINERCLSISSLLKDFGYNIPDIFPGEGLIVNDEKIKVGIWIMPNNNQSGMLEDFISFLIPHDDVLLPFVTNTLDSIEADNLNKYSKIHRAKATIHTWLALQEDPGTPMGLAVTKKYLTTDSDNCLKLINWMKLVFS